MERLGSQKFPFKSRVASRPIWVPGFAMLINLACFSLENGTIVNIANAWHQRDTAHSSTRFYQY